MKKVLTILMLAIAIIAVASTADAKTKKKAKSSSSASWNGDIPSASLIFNSWNKAQSQLKQHGYKITKEDDSDLGYEVTWTKPGVCEIYYYDGIEAGDTSWDIVVYDSAKCTKLYNDFKQLLKSYKYWDVYRKGNELNISYWH